MLKQNLSIVFLSVFLLCTALVSAVNAATLSDAKMAIRSQQFSTAAGILKPLAKAGDKKAQYQLAVLYRNGQGVKQNYERAAYWMQQSAEQGFKRAQYSLAVYYEDGEGVKKNRDRAIHWYAAAASQGHNLSLIHI